MNMRFTRLDDWLRWQETLHPQVIDLGLQRVAEVYRALGAPVPARRVITVAGTNGKGSSVALLEHLFSAAGYRVGSYTSPHLLRYNERIRILGDDVSDQQLIDAFAAIDEARGARSLTYFEFGTLAALLILSRQRLDLAVLEVGMGGRLDATNIIDADISLITSIGLDHQAWLGSTREQIAIEKAGIMRQGRPAVCGDAEPPMSLLEHAATCGAVLQRVGSEFDFSAAGDGWSWRGLGASGNAVCYDDLPLPAASAVTTHLRTAAAAIQAAEWLQAELPFNLDCLRQALRHGRPPGRCQLWRQRPEVWLDVAHNPQAAHVLAAHLSALPRRPTHLVFAVLADKAAAEMLGILAPQTDHYYLSSPACERALPLVQLRAAFKDCAANGDVFEYASVAAAYLAALQRAATGDRIVVTGSFYTVAEVMAAVDG